MARRDDGGGRAPGLRLGVEGRVGRITLDRPQALNALSLEMVHGIDRALAAWADDPAVAMVLIDGAGERAFCAGGDIVDVYESGRRGDFASGRRFWADEYRMNFRLAHFPKPFVALMHGYVMGGGVGVSAHGSHRVVGATSRVAMPECAIGLIPDIGASHLLARAPGALGEYLGLTGHRMRAGDAILAGFADLFVREDRWPALVARLLATADPGEIAGFAEAAPEPELAPHREAIDGAFSAPDLAALVARLEVSAWGHAVLATLRGQCPLSMACTLELVRAARREPGLAKALVREYRFSARAASDGELLEGVRAAVIDKDRAPRWRDDIDSLRRSEVIAMLAPLDGEELSFGA
jgi:enoyl-CoA hydratase/carnithine racemase